MVKIYNAASFNIVANNNGLIDNFCLLKIKTTPQQHVYLITAEFP
jgi:hypothetical protein